MNRTKIFIAISSIALVIVLIFQINWILKTAEIKEALFNEKANMVLTRTSEALAADTATCRNMKTRVGKNEIAKIDSLFTYYMNFYSFHIDYTFEVLVPAPEAFIKPVSLTLNNGGDPLHKHESALHAPTEPRCYQNNLEQTAIRNGFELKLNFPGKEQYILAEMGAPFISSVVLIIVVLILFWRTTVSLVKEKEISEHTTDFLNNMTHEFKTPLTNIALAGKMITKDSTIKHEEKIKHYSGIILEENEKLRLQVEQVLSMTALERGEIPIQKTELDLHQLLRDCLKNIQIQIENKQGSIQTNLNAGHFVVNGDKAHLTNAIYNLIDNAVKYSKEKPDLSIHTSNTGQNISISVSDRGIGISKEHQKKVFEKFFRVPTGDVHDVKGFGLGLAYIKAIIEKHEGTIELQSEKGKGTTFIINLPYV